MYMTQDEIRALSRRIPAIINSTCEELDFWMDDAFDILNNFCQQDFVYERQVTKRVRATTNTIVYLPKVLSGIVTIQGSSGNTLYSSISAGINTSTSAAFTDSGSNGGVELFPGTFMLGWYKGNLQFRSRDAETLFVTGDWGFVPTKEELLLQGITTLVTSYEAHRQDALVHNIADLNNVVTSLPATVALASMLLLINELRLDINAHFGDLIVHNLDDTNVTLLPAATDLDTAIELLLDLRTKFNEHLLKGGTPTDVHLFVDSDNEATVSSDFNYAIMPRQIRRAFLRLVQRIAIRDDAEDHRQMNSPYTSETLGDGYSYDLSNGTLRNLIRPEEAHMLLPYVNRGRIVI